MYCIQGTCTICTLERRLRAACPTKQDCNTMCLSDGCCCAMQAMADSTEGLLAMRWQHSGCRDVYKDFNALTLQVTTQALFGEDLPAAEGVKITGQVLSRCMHAQQMPPAHLKKGKCTCLLAMQPSDNQPSMNCMHQGETLGSHHGRIPNSKLANSSA